MFLLLLLVSSISPTLKHCPTCCGLPQLAIVAVFKHKNCPGRMQGWPLLLLLLLLLSSTKRIVQGGCRGGHVDRAWGFLRHHGCASIYITHIYLARNYVQEYTAALYCTLYSVHCTKNAVNKPHGSTPLENPIHEYATTMITTTWVQQNESENIVIKLANPYGIILV